TAAMLHNEFRNWFKSKNKALAMQRELKKSAQSNVRLACTHFWEEERSVLCTLGMYTTCDVLCSQRELNDVRPLHHCSSSGKRESYNERESNESNSSVKVVEALKFDPHVGTLLLPYREIRKEIQNNHIEQESQRAWQLSHMLKWSVVDHYLL
ncbi:22713_t:CDS:2, partial [Gigaspora rosea]